MLSLAFICDYHYFPFFFNIYFYFYYKARYTERKRDREEDPPVMNHSPSEYNGQCCADLESGARNLLQVCYREQGPKALGQTSHPGLKQGAGWEV